MAPKIVIIGSNGLLGRRLSAAFREMRQDIVTHAHTGPADVRFDLRDFEATRFALDRIRPDVLVNLVSLTDVDECERNPQKAQELNTETVRTLARWMDLKPETHLVQLSTDQVYDGKGPHAESDVSLKNEYARTKYSGERVALGVGGTVLRTNFFGRASAPSRKTLSDWILDNLFNQASMTLFTDILFSPLSFHTLCPLIGAVVARGTRGLFNLGSRAGMSKYDFAVRIAKTFGLEMTNARPGLSSAASLSAYRPKDMRMDCSLFEKTMGVHLPTLGEEISNMRREYEMPTAA